MHYPTWHSAWAAEPILPLRSVRAQRHTLRAGRAADSSVECPEPKRAISLG